MIKRFLSLIILTISLSACATVNRGATDHFRIDTVPQGATVTTSIKSPKGKTRAERRESISKRNISDNIDYIGCSPTPCAIQLPRRSEFVAKIEYPGYEPTEIFVRTSKLKGGTTTSATANLATASGSGFAIAGTIASFETFLTFGFQSVNSSGIAASGAAAGLGVGAGMIAIDAVSGANLNLFPNPVVIELAPQGAPTRKDPLVDLYWNMIESESISDTICTKRKKDIGPDEPSCSEARADYQQKRQAFKTLKHEQLETLKAAIKVAKIKQKAEKSQ